MKKSFLLMVMFMFLLLGTSCTTNSHFGVPDQAYAVKSVALEKFNETEAAIAQSEKSSGAKYCPEKIASAKELGKKGVETWWSCNQPEAWKLFEEAVKVAQEAEKCQPPPPPPAPALKPVAPPPPPPPPPPPTPPTPPPPPPSDPRSPGETVLATVLIYIPCS